jgi:hypothetical protein
MWPWLTAQNFEIALRDSSLRARTRQGPKLSSQFPRQKTTEFFSVSRPSADAFDGGPQRAPFSFFENGPQGVSRAMNSFDLKDDLLFDHS